MSYAALMLLFAQTAGAQEFDSLIRGNEHFGRNLLEAVHRADPERNVVVSPISLTIAFAAIEHGSRDSDLRREIANTFGWGGTKLASPARALLAGFKKPGPPRPITLRAGKVEMHPPPEMPQGKWITNTILFLSKIPETGEPIKPFEPEFIEDATRYFGMQFAATDARQPSADDLRRVRGSTGALPSVSHWNDFWISSGAHLQTRWRGNTFSLSQPFVGEFRTAGGITKKVEMLTSESADYRHAVTDSFEAVVLPCDIAYMIAVLPMPGRDIYQLERELARSPDVLDSALKKDRRGHHAALSHRQRKRVAAAVRGVGNPQSV